MGVYSKELRARTDHIGTLGLPRELVRGILNPLSISNTFYLIRRADNKKNLLDLVVTPRSIHY